MIQLDQPQILYSKVLRVTGPDGSKFLQGQLTCDVLALQDQQTTLGSYCNIQGKVEFVFKITKVAEDYLLHMPTSMLESIKQELHKYAVFSKVSLEITERPEYLTPPDPHQEILTGIPEVYPTTRNMFFAHDLNLPALGAVSFTKGCYRGQEIVARMQHRGNLKRTMQLFKSSAHDFEPGSVVHNQNGDSVGKIVRYVTTVDQSLILAVVDQKYLDQNLFVLDHELVWVNHKP